MWLDPLLHREVIDTEEHASMLSDVEELIKTPDRVNQHPEVEKLR